MVDMVALKTRSRRALHKAMAAQALYTAPGDTVARPVSVRYHNFPVLGFAMQSITPDGASIFNGQERLIFNATELASPSDGGAAIVLAYDGQVEIHGYSPAGSLKLSLDSLARSDGPENIYWSVTESS